MFLLFIFILLILGFNLSVHLSQTDTKLKELTQQLAIEKFERYCNDRELQVAQDEVEQANRQTNVAIVEETVIIDER